jgi:hypothetical protein
VKAISGNPIARDSFLNDVTVNGVINSSDIGTVKPQSGTSLPAAADPKSEEASKISER